MVLFLSLFWHNQRILQLESHGSSPFSWDFGGRKWPGDIGQVHIGKLGPWQPRKRSDFADPGWSTPQIGTSSGFGSKPCIVALVNIKIAGIYGWEHPTNIDNNRFWHTPISYQQTFKYVSSKFHLEISWNILKWWIPKPPWISSDLVFLSGRHSLAMAALLTSNKTWRCHA